MLFLAAVKSHMKYLRDNRNVRSPTVQKRVRIRSRQQRVSEYVFFKVHVYYYVFNYCRYMKDVLEVLKQKRPRIGN